MASTRGRILVTGANGNLGRRLLERLAAEDGPAPRALVRSERAAVAVRELRFSDRIELAIADWNDAPALERAMAGCERVVHLIGILKETKATRYADAHEATCRALVAAAGGAGILRIVYLGILGSSTTSTNACLASKGRAEEILRTSGIPTTTLRVPMVLGPGDIAARALRAKALAPFVVLPRAGATLEQPIDADDVVRAIVAALDASDPAGATLELAGPESLPHRDLVRRAAALHGRSPRILGVPVGAVGLFAALAERAFSNPPLTRAMLGVLEHDDRIDPGPACRVLGLALTPLDVTLRRCVGPDAEADR
ncbi:NADH dehydrogenase,E; NADH dehydrogenase [Myxococcaceae bacterium]|jgi:NADH dehydrogenase|nr:NADH dehydrogenase,E; NADH dehydrogenase [Myxococcaceae bacterium]